MLLEKCVLNFLIVFFDKSTHFKLKTASVTPFREPMPAISHFSMLARKPDKWLNWLRLLINYLTDGISLKKKVESSV